MRLHPKIEELKKRAAPIAYSTSFVDSQGNLQERQSLIDQRIVEGYGVIWGQIICIRNGFLKAHLPGQ